MVRKTKACRFQLQTHLQRAKHSFPKRVLFRSVRKYAGVDDLVQILINKLGDIETAYIIGDYANGVDSGLIDIVLIGKINKVELDRIAERRSKDISRKIRSLVLTKKELRSLWDQLKMDKALLIWGKPISKN